MSEEQISDEELAAAYANSGWPAEAVTQCLGLERSLRDTREALAKVQRIAKQQVEIASSWRREVTELLKQYRPDDPRLATVHLNDAAQDRGEEND